MADIAGESRIAIEDIVEFGTRVGATVAAADDVIDAGIDQGLRVIVYGIAGENRDIASAGKIGNGIRQFVEIIGVVARAAAHDIAARAAIKAIVAGIAVERIVARAALEVVIARTTGNGIVIGIAGEGPILTARIGNVLDAREFREIAEGRRSRIAGEDRRIAAIATRLVHHVIGGIEHIDIVASAAIELVVTGSAIQNVVAAAAGKIIVARPAGDRVVFAVASEGPTLRSSIGNVLDTGEFREIAEGRRRRIAGEDDAVVRIGIALLVDDIRGAIDIVSVVAGAALHHIVAGAADDIVVAGAADDRVVLRPTIQNIVAVAAVDQIVAGAARENIVELVAENLIVATFPIEHIGRRHGMAGIARESLVAMEDIVVRRAIIGNDDDVLDSLGVKRGDVVALIDHALRDIDGVVGIGIAAFVDDIVEIVDIIGIVARPAGHSIGALAAIELVVTAAADQDVVVILAEDLIVAVAAIEEIVARSAPQDIVAVIAENLIVAGTAIEIIVAGPADQIIVAAMAAHDIVAALGVDIIVARPAIDDVVLIRALNREIRDDGFDAFRLQISRHARQQRGQYQGRIVGAVSRGCNTRVKADALIDRVVGIVDDIEIVARTADQVIGTRAAIQDIVADPAFQRVVSGAADQMIVAGIAGENVIPRTAGDRIIGAVANEGPSRRALEGEILDAGKLTGIEEISDELIITEFDRVAGIGIPLLVDFIIDVIQHIGVVAGTAKELVVAGTANQRVVALHAAQFVVAGLTVELIVAEHALEIIGFAGAVDLLRAGIDLEPDALNPGSPDQGGITDTGRGRIDDGAFGILIKDIGLEGIESRRSCAVAGQNLIINGNAVTPFEDHHIAVIDQRFPDFDIAALALVDLVFIAIDIIGVVARSADQAIIAGAADQRIVADTAIERVVAFSGRQDVVEFVADDGDIGRGRTRAAAGADNAAGRTGLATRRIVIRDISRIFDIGEFVKVERVIGRRARIGDIVEGDLALMKRRIEEDRIDAAARLHIVELFRDRVDFGCAPQDISIVAGAAGQAILAEQSAIQPIVTEPAIELIVALAAIEAIVAGIAEDDVVEIVAGAIDIGRTGQRQILDRRVIVLDIRILGGIGLEAQIEIDRGFDEIDALAADKVEDRIAGHEDAVLVDGNGVDDVSIGSIAALQAVGTETPIEDIIAGIADQRFGAVAAIGIGLVLAAAEIDDFDAFIDEEIDRHRTLDRIDAAAGADGRILIGAVADIVENIFVVAGAADHEIGALAAIQSVVALAAIEEIVAGAACDRIVGAISGESPGAFADEDVILDAGNELGRGGRGLNRIARAGIPLLVDDIVDGIHDIGIAAGAAGHDIVPLTAIQSIGAARPHQHIVAVEALNVAEIEDRIAVLRALGHALGIGLEAAGFNLDDIAAAEACRIQNGAIVSKRRAGQDNGIRTAAIDNLVVEVVEDIGVVAGSAIENIRAGTARKRIVAKPAGDIILARTAGDEIVAAIAREGPVAIAAIDNLLDIGEIGKIGKGADRRIKGKIDRIRAFARILDDDIASGIDFVEIVARAALHRIVAGPAEEVIVARWAVRTAVQNVIPGSAHLTEDEFVDIRDLVVEFGR